MNANFFLIENEAREGQFNGRKWLLWGNEPLLLKNGVKEEKIISRKELLWKSQRFFLLEENEARRGQVKDTKRLL